MVIRQLEVPAGPYTDTDWLNPAVVPPDSARRFMVTDTELRFAMRGRVSSAPDADLVTLGAMTVDAYVMLELPGGGTIRGKSVQEVEDGVLPAQMMMAATVTRGSIGRLHLTLTDVSAPVVEVLLVSGGRPL